MWQIDNRTPFAAAQGWVRDRRGAEVFLVVVKATFDILPDGTTNPAAEQPEPLRLADDHGEPGKSSIRHELDFVLTKRTTDVLVVGHAHAPQGHAVRQVDVGLMVGSLRKSLRVFGDRRWEGGAPTRPVPFVVMPLVYHAPLAAWTGITDARERLGLAQSRRLRSRGQLSASGQPTGPEYRGPGTADSGMEGSTGTGGVRSDRQPLATPRGAGRHL